MAAVARGMNHLPDDPDRVPQILKRTKGLIIAGPDTLTQLGLTAAVQNNILVIVRHGCRLTISTRRFRPVSFPDLDGVEARLVSFGQAEIVVNKAVLISEWQA